MKSFNRFSSKGRAESLIDKRREAEIRTVNENCINAYSIWAIDCSGSMSWPTCYINEKGEEVSKRKIDQANEGMHKVIGAFRDIEDKTPLLRIKLNMVEINSYGKSVFPTFQPVTRHFDEMRFEAEGCTNFRATFETIKTLLHPKHLQDGRKDRAGKPTNRPVYIYFMSDGYPTDVNGIELTPEQYRADIDEFKADCRKMGYENNIIISCIAVGDACIDMLRYLADGDEDLGENSRVFYVGDCESIPDGMVFATCSTFNYNTLDIPLPEDDEDDEDDSDDDEDYDDYVDDTDEDDEAEEEDADAADEDGKDDEIITDEDSDITLDQLCDGLI